MMEKITTTYEKHKHFDKLLRELLLSDNPIYGTAAELWMAIAETVEEQGPYYCFACEEFWTDYEIRMNEDDDYICPDCGADCSVLWEKEEERSEG